MAWTKTRIQRSSHTKQNNAIRILEWKQTQTNENIR